MAAIWITGFEHGVSSTSGGGVFNAITGAGPTVQGTTKRTGSYALQVVSQAADSYVSKTWTGVAVLTGRFYIRVSPLYTADNVNYIRFNTVSSTCYISVRASASGGWFGFYEPTLGDVNANVAPVAGTWYRIDFRIDTTSKTFDWKIDGSAQTQRTIGTMGNVTGIDLGVLYGGITTTVQFDDLIFTNSSGDYGFSDVPSEVVGLMPSGAGSSNLSTGIEDNASVDVNDSSNPADIELDEVPLGSATDYIKQVGTASTNYAAVAFADTDKTTILGAMALEAYRSASASPSNSASAKIYDEDAVETAIYTGDMTETSTFYKSVVCRTPTGGWDMAAVNALQGRVGYATDYAPVPYFYGIMVEVAYAVSSAIDLVAAEGYQTQLSDAPALTQLHVLTAAEGYQTQLSDAPALTQTHELVPDQTAYQTQGSDQATIALIIPLVPAEGAQEQVSDNAALTQLHVLVVAEGAQTQASDVPTLTQVHGLVTAEGSQNQVSDAPALTQVHVLASAEGFQTQGSDGAALTVEHNLVVQEGVQDQLSDLATLTVEHNLVVQDGYQVQVSDQATITIGGIDLVAAEGMQTVVSDSPVLTQVHVLAAQDGVQTQGSDVPALAQVHVLAAEEGYQTQLSDQATLAFGAIDLVAAEGVQTQASDSPNLSQVHNLSPAEGVQEQISDLAYIDFAILLAIQKGYQDQFSDSPELMVLEGPWAAGYPALEGAWSAGGVTMEPHWPLDTILGQLELGADAFGDDPVSLEPDWDEGSVPLEPPWAD